MTDEIRLIHLADVHLGYAGSNSLLFKEGEKFAGHYVREIDIEQAVKRLTLQIILEKPKVDLVVIAGDLFDKRVPTPRAVRVAARMVRRLVAQGIEVVIIEGNHEVSSGIHTGSPISYLKEVGAQVFETDKWHIIQGDQWQVNESLNGRLVLHTLPYRAVSAGNFTGLSPLSGLLNVLVTHGGVQGMDKANTLGEINKAIPPSLLRQGWDYVALGDWHIPAYKIIDDAPAYYSGSLEALNFGEASIFPVAKSDPHARRGGLDVTLKPGQPAAVTIYENHEFRPVLKLKPVEARELEAVGVMELIRQRLSADLPSEAIIHLEINECSPIVHERLDHAEIDGLKQKVRRCKITWNFKQQEIEDSTTVASEETLSKQWEDFLKQNDSAWWQENERDWFLAQGNDLLEEARSSLYQLRVAQDED